MAKLVAPGTVKLNGTVYAVARDRRGDLQFSHRSGPVERGLGLWEHEVFKSGVAGMGYGREDPLAAPYGFYYSQNCMTVLDGALGLPPTVTTLSSTLSTQVRHFFEDKDRNDQYYLYALAVGEVAKIKLGATPSLVGVETASFESTDAFGQPIRIRTVEAAFQEDAFQNDAFTVFTTPLWFLPPDSADRIIELTRVEPEPTADVWTVRETVIKGASQFVIAGRNFWRAIATGFGPQVSACDVLSDCALDASWGADFPFGDQGDRITAILALHRFILIVTESNLYGATEDFDPTGVGGAISFSEMLPDVQFRAEEVDGHPVTGLGSIIWDAAALVPAAYTLYRHDLSGYSRIGPDSFLFNNGDEPNLTDQIRFGVHRGLTTTGNWVYAIYEMPDASGFYILAGRKRVPGEGGLEPMVWQPIHYRATGQVLNLRVTKNETGDPRLWWVVDNGDIEQIALGLDGGPFLPGGSFGDVSSNGDFLMKSFDLNEPGTPKLLREVEVIVDDSATALTWQNRMSADGAALENIGGAIGASGSTTEFFASNKQARRIIPVLRWVTAGGFTPAGNSTRVRRCIYRGSWLPNVADVFTLLVDVHATARRNGTSTKKVRDDLQALILSGGYPFVDIHGSPSVQVTVDEGGFQEGREIAGLEGREMVEIRLTVEELS